MADPLAPEDRDGLAAELALGLLDGSERAAALRLCLSDPDFAGEVEAWSLRLSPLLTTVSGALPSERVWHSVEARIGGGPDTFVVRRLRLWRSGALAAGAIAASLALFLVTRPILPVSTPVNGPAAVSQLASANGNAIMAVAYDPAKGALRLSRTTLGGDGKAPELWIIPADGIPRSLGVIAANSSELPVDGKLRRFLKGGAILAITLEDPATAPHKAPTAPPILTGKITII